MYTYKAIMYTIMLHSHQLNSWKKQVGKNTDTSQAKLDHMNYYKMMKELELYVLKRRERYVMAHARQQMEGIIP